MVKMKSTSVTLLSLPILFAQLSAAIVIDCTQNIIVDSKKFDFSKLNKAHSIMVSDETRPPAIHNMTWTVNICKPLERTKNIPDVDQCPSGTNICGIEKSYNPSEESKVETTRVIPIVGTWAQDSGHTMEPKWTRLQATDSKAGGLQLDVTGRKYGNRKQKAVINFQCDKDRNGDEGTVEAEKEKRDDDDKKNDPSLTFVSYDPASVNDEMMDVLHLNWRTKFACEDYQDGNNVDTDPKHGWGFFTWFIVIGFLGIAAYLIFGSWLNYNRYGARGWDLLPHGDTIRDAPYLFKDWSRKVVGTVAGGGSRGGYSAV